MPHLNGVYNLVYFLCGNTSDTEDLVQDTYLKAYLSFDTYADKNSRAWIFTIARNTCYSWFRKQSKLNVSFDEEMEDINSQIFSSNVSCFPSPEDAVEAKHNQRWFQLAIEELSLEFREVIVLREMEELSYYEISKILDVPKGTVMSRLSRARKVLKNKLMDITRIECNEV